MKKIACVVGAGLLALAMTACSDDSGSAPSNDSSPSSSAPPPPPPEAFGHPHDWGNGNSVTVQAPQIKELPGPLHAAILLVQVTNGGDQAVDVHQYHAEVKVNNQSVGAAPFGLANLPTGQVQSHSPAQFPVVFEAPAPGANVSVDVTGPNSLPVVTYAGPTPAK